MNVFAIIKDKSNQSLGVYRLKKENISFNQKNYFASKGFSDIDNTMNFDEKEENNNSKFILALTDEQLEIDIVKCIYRGKRGKKLIYYVKLKGKDLVSLSHFEKVNKSSCIRLCKRKVRKYQRNIKFRVMETRLLSMEWNKWDTLYLVILGAIFGISLFLDIRSNKEDYTKTVIISVLAFFRILKTVSEKIKKIKNFSQDSKMVSLTDVKKETKENIIQGIENNLSSKYKDFEFQNFTFADGKTEIFMFSKKENTYFQKNAHNMTLKLQKEKHISSSDSRKALASIVETKLQQDKIIFNGKLLGMGTDLNFEEAGMCLIKKVRYHQYISCDELIFKNITVATDPLYFKRGKDMCISPETCGLKEIEKSPLTNLFGINILVKIKENSGKEYVIINVQSSYNDANRGRLVPSGSGSVGAEDLSRKNFKKFMGVKGKAKTLEELLKIGMLRELEEETFLNDTFRKNGRFTLLGFSRLINKGGKPDFFGMLEIEINSKEEILKNYNYYQNKSVGKSITKYPLESDFLLLISKDEFLNSTLWESYASPQLRYLKMLILNQNEF